MAHLGHRPARGPALTPVTTAIVPLNKPFELNDTQGSKTVPLVPVNDVDLPAGSDTLFAAAYGRGVWTTSLADIG